MLADIIKFIVDTVADWGYFGIFAMMFLESSFFPFPSEVVMVPAGYLASKGEMNLLFAIGAGIFGSLIGALFNYYLAKHLGRGLLEKYGKYLFISPQTIQKMEDFFQKHGHISTFTGRLLPGIRQYISLPAGLSQMNMAQFALYTTLGAGIWVIILAAVGYFVGGHEDLIKLYLKEITIAIVLLLTVGIAIYSYHYQQKKKESL